MADTIVVSRAPLNTRRRSNTGCWTCRLRRKKCDELGEGCRTCSVLGLPCAGYGPRPAWMDGGESEKAKAQELKTLVVRHRRRRRYSKPSCCSTLDLGGAASIHQRRHSVETTSAEDREVHRAVEPPMSLSRSLGDNSQGGISSPSPLSLIAAFNNNSLDADCLWPLLSETIGDGASHDGPFDEELSCSEISRHEPLPASNGQFFPSTASPSFVPYDHDRISIELQNVSELVMDAFVEPKPLQCSAVADGASGDIIRLDADAVTSSIPTEPSKSEQYDPNSMRATIEFYCYHVLTPLFPYLPDDVRSHICSRVTGSMARCEALMFSSLSHSSHFRLSSLTSFGLESVGSLRRLVDSSRRSALGCLSVIRSQSLGSSSPGFDEDVLVCLVQLRLLQVQLGFPNDDDVVDVVRKYVQSIDIMHPQSLLYVPMCVALHGLDILQYASCGQRSLPADYSTCSESLRIISQDESCILGPESWVFAILAEINNLRELKKKAVAARMLNVAAFVRGATTIEDRIISSQQARKEASSRREYDVTLLTDAYAAAMQIYLHVLVSGANPEISDIQDRTNDFMQVLQRSSHPMVLRQLCWPICIAACLAESRHDAFFRSVESGAQCDVNFSSGILRALTVAKQCQKLRRECSDHIETFDWFDAMRSLGEAWTLA